MGELTKACQRISILAVLRVTAQSLVRTINSTSSKSSRIQKMTDSDGFPK